MVTMRIIEFMSEICKKMGIRNYQWKLCTVQNLKLYKYFAAVVDADYVIILDENTNTMKKNADALLEASREVGIEINAGKSKYMVVSRDQNGGQKPFNVMYTE